MTKSDFAVSLLEEYATENQVNKRSTSDLSPLEEWLIIKLYNMKPRLNFGEWLYTLSNKYRLCKNDLEELITMGWQQEPTSIADLVNMFAKFGTFVGLDKQKQKQYRLGKTFFVRIGKNYLQKNIIMFTASYSLNIFGSWTCTSNSDGTIETISSRIIENPSPDVTGGGQFKLD